MPPKKQQRKKSEPKVEAPKQMPTPLKKTMGRKRSATAVKDVLSIEAMIDSGLLLRGDDPSLIVQRILFGIPDLDAAMGGGIPRHRITLLTGSESSGKTFVLQLLFLSAIHQGLQVAYIDTEQTYDPIWWGQIGLPLDKLLVSQPTIGEQAVDLAVALVKNGIDVVAVDSLAALVPMQETEQNAEKQFIGLQARLIGKLMRLLLSAKHNSAVVCTNQLRQGIGGPVPFETMPGGVGQKYLASLILRMTRTGWIEPQGERIGFSMRVVASKNKVGTPYGECVLPFLFRGVIDVLSMLLDRGIEAGIIQQKGPYYQMHFGGLDGEAILGRNSVLTRLEEQPELQDALKKSLGE